MFNFVRFRTIKLKLTLVTFIAKCLLLFAFTSEANAANGFTYSGRILDANDLPVSTGNITFYVWIQTSSYCSLYSEQHVVNMADSGGTFTLEIGTGTNQAFQTAPSNILTMKDVFDNSKKPADFNTGAVGCSNVVLTEDDIRILRVEFVPPGQVVAQSLPPLRITQVPTAIHAMNAAKVGGYGTGELLKVGSTVTQTHGNLTQTNYDEFIKLILGTSTTYLKTIPSLGGDISGTLPAVSVDKIKGIAVTAPVGGDNGKVLTYDSAGAGSLKWTTPAAGGGITSINGQSGSTQSFASGTTALSINSAANTHTLSISNASSSADGLLSSTDWTTFNSKQSSSLASGQVWIGNASNVAQARNLVASDITGALTYTPVNKAGDTMAGNLNMGAGNFLGLGASAAPGTVAGQIWYNAGKVYYYNGSGAQELGVAGAGITSFNGETGSTQSFGAIDLGTSVLVPTWSSATNVHTLKIPMASDTGVTAGLLSKADHTSFSAKLTSPLTTKGDLLTRDGTTHVRVPVGNNNEVLMADSTQASGLKWAAIPAGGITSLNGLSSGSQTFAIGTSGNSPAFNSGTNTHTLNIPLASASGTVSAGLISNAEYVALNNKMSGSLSAGQVWVGNSSNGAQARALSGDIASVSDTGLVTAAKTTVGLANTLVSTDGTGVINSFGVGLQGSTGGTVTLSSITGTTANYSLKFPATAPAAGQALQSDALGNLSWFDPGSATALNATSGYSVRATTAGANITLSGTQTIDGVALVDGDRVLVRNQGNYAENGVYVVSSGVWTRAADLDTWAETVGYQATVKEGTYWAGMRFIVNSSASGTIDSSAMYINPLGGSNQLGSSTGLGHLALWGNTTGSSNNAFGWGALQFSTTGSANIAFGASALRWNKTGNYNVAVGSSALSENVAKNESTAVGYRSMYRADSTSTASVSYNTAVGAYSLQGSSTAGNNTGTKNTALGHSSLMATTSGSSNTAIGNYTGATLTTGSGNIFIGNNSGSAVTTGSNNVIIGSHTGSTIATTSNNILIADGAGNQRIIVDSTGKVGIGGSPTYNLDVVGDINVTGNFKVNGTNISTGGGITSLNGLSSAAQTFAIGTSGNSPAFDSTTNTHTLNIPMASSSGSVTAGLLSNAEYVALNSKMSSSLSSGQLWVGNSGNTAEARTISGDFTVDATGAATANKTSTGVASKLLELTASSVAVTKGLAILGATSGTLTVQAPATVTTYTLTLPSTGGSANQVLTTNGSGTTSWTTSPGAATVVSKTSNFTVGTSENNYVYLITNSTTATLPTAASAGSGFRATFKRMGNANVNVKGNGSETIDGTNQRSLQSSYQSLALISTGTEWIIIGGGANTTSTGCSTGNQTYSGSGTYTFTITAAQAANCTYSFTVKGGGGANGYAGQGGKGGAVQFTYKPPSEGTFEILIGGGATGTSGGGGNGGNGNSGTYYGGGGGGASAVRYTNTTPTDLLLSVVGGGGGGGSVNSADDGGNGGAVGAGNNGTTYSVSSIYGYGGSGNTGGAANSNGGAGGSSGGNGSNGASGVVGGSGVAAFSVSGGGGAATASTSSSGGGGAGYGGGSGGGATSGPYTSGGGGGGGYINSGVVNSFNDVTSSQGTSAGASGSVLVEWN